LSEEASREGSRLQITPSKRSKRIQSINPTVECEKKLILGLQRRERMKHQKNNVKMKPNSIKIRVLSMADVGREGRKKLTLNEKSKMD
jgi:hypothetical protein